MSTPETPHPLRTVARAILRIPVFLAPLALGFLVAFGFTKAFEGLRATVPADQVWLGWTYYDIPSYYANAREVFENGNGLFYANPYSLDRTSPHAFTNLQIVAMAWLWKAGVTFQAQEVYWRIASWTLLFGLLWWFVAAYVPPGRWRVWTYLLAAFGGGITVLPALGVALSNWLFPAAPVAPAGSSPSFVQLFVAADRHLEGIWGWWFLNPLRNILYTTECFYHVLFFAAVLAVVYQQFGVAVLFTALTWWAHPFTGLELGGILCLWAALEGYLAWRHDEPLAHWVRLFAGLAFLNILFLLYYGPFLAGIDEQRSVMEIWRGPEAAQITTAPLTHVFLSYGPLLLGLLWLGTRSGRELFKSPVHRLLVVWVIVVFLLMHHDKLPFVRHPAQPLHFARGYDYLVLCIWMGTGLAQIWRDRPEIQRWVTALGAAMLVVLVADNAVFFGRYFLGGEAREKGILSIPQSEYTMLERLKGLPGNRLVFTLEEQPTREIGYLLNTYTSHRSFLGHGTNSPYLRDRTSAYWTWVRKPDRAFLDTIQTDAIVVDESFASRQEWARTKKVTAVLDELLAGGYVRTLAPTGYALWLKREK